MSKTVLRWGLSTDVGRLRNVNQDAGMANGSLFVVADGMGGHQGGEEASRIAIGSMSQVASVESVDELEAAVRNANMLIREKGSAEPQLSGMGTTVVALGVLPASKNNGALYLAAANVGDSRLYVLEDGSFEQLTLDHSLVAELERAGQITSDEASRHPQRNVVTRALGADDEVDVDTWTFRARHGQRYVLCSDGLVNEVTNAEIRDQLMSNPEPADAVKKLVDAANRSGGRDNITVLVVDVTSESC